MFNLLIGNGDNYRIYCRRTKGEAELKHFFIYFLTSGLRTFVAVVSVEK